MGFTERLWCKGIDWCGVGLHTINPSTWEAGRGQPGLQRKFQDIQGKIENPVSKQTKPTKPTKPTNKQTRKKEVIESTLHAKRQSEIQFKPVVIQRKPSLVIK